MQYLERKKILFFSFLVSGVIIFTLNYMVNLSTYWSIGSQNTPYEIAKLITSVSGTILGFLLTAVAMLTAVMDRKLVENMKKTGHYQIFIKDCFTNCFLLLITIILGITSLFLEGPKLEFSFISVLFFALSSIIYLVFLGRRFLIIFTHL